jgi:HEPN domain-containing protein
MPHDPARVADTKAWLARAADDLQAAEQLLSGSSALPGVAVFHCQQAAEKAMKAFLAWHDVPFRKTHDLEKIGEACLAIDRALEEVVDRAVPLTEYAWKFRYPGEPASPTQNEAEASLALAGRVYHAIVARLPEEARP